MSALTFARHCRASVILSMIAISIASLFRWSMIDMLHFDESSSRPRSCIRRRRHAQARPPLIPAAPSYAVRRLLPRSPRRRRRPGASRRAADEYMRRAKLYSSRRPPDARVARLLQEGRDARQMMLFCGMPMMRAITAGWPQQLSKSRASLPLAQARWQASGRVVGIFSPRTFYTRHAHARHTISMTSYAGKHIGRAATRGSLYESMSVAWLHRTSGRRAARGHHSPY